MHELLDKFLKFLETTKKLSSNTLESYKRDVSQYIDYLKSISITKIEKTNSDVINSYLAELKTEGKSNATVSRHIASIRSFYQYLVRVKRAKEDPTMKLKAPKIEKRTPQILSTDEVALLLAQPDKSNLKGFRDKAMLEVLYSTGMRVSELICLDITDLDLEGNKISCSDGNRKRTMNLTKMAVKSVKEYIENSRQNMLKNLNEQALFVNLNGTRLTRQGFWKIIKYYKEMAKIDKDITPHMLRHSFAMHLVQNGADVKALKELLGHNDVASTNVYFNLAEEYNSLNLRAQ